MRHRVEDLLLPAGIRPPLIATFHSACVRILRERAVHAGLPPSFVIYDEDDRQSLVKEALRELDFDERTLTPSTVVHRISHCKNQMLTPADVEQLARTPREERIAVALPALRAEAPGRRRASTSTTCCCRVVRLLETVPEALALVPRALEPRPGRRVPGHQPRPVPHRPAADRGAPEPLRGGRSRPVDLPVARGRSPQHPRLREGLPRLPGGARSSRTTARPSASSASPPRSSPTTPRARTSGCGPRTTRASGAQVYRAWDENEEAAFVAQKVRALRGEGARLPRRGGVLPHQRPVARAGGRAAPRAASPT